MERYVSSAPSCVGEGDLRRGVAGKLHEQRVGLIGGTEGLLVGLLRHVDGVAQVVDRDRLDRQHLLVERARAQLDLVAHREAQDLGRVVGRDDAALGKLDRRAVGILELHIPREREAVGHHVELHRGAVGPVDERRVVDGELHEAVHPVARLEVGAGRREVVGQGHRHEVVAVHAVVLPGGQRVHGVLDGKAAHEQHRAAQDAEDRHEEARLVAEQVARRHLVEERHAAPQRADALEQDALAGLRGLGAHEARPGFGAGRAGRQTSWRP